MMHMAADFEVEGITGDWASTMPPIGTTRVTLETDGRVVRLVAGFGGNTPPLTPFGWSQLAGAAARLLTEAVAAAHRAGTAPDEGQP